MKKGKVASATSPMETTETMVSPGSTRDGIPSNTGDIPSNSETLPSPADSGRTMGDKLSIGYLIPAREPEIVPGSPKRRKFGGRQKGTPNRITRDVRTALRDLAENNADQVQGWLDSVAQNDPAEAIRLYLMLCRFVAPTLSARAIADITPKSQRETLAAMTDEELLACLIESPEARRLAKQGSARTKEELLMQLAFGTPTTLELEESDSTNEIDELMR